MHTGQLFPAVCFWKNLIPDAVKYWFSLTSVKALIFLLWLNNLSNKIFLPFWTSINDLTRPPQPVFPVYNLTRSPLTAPLYYLNAWNRLADIHSGRAKQRFQSEQRGMGGKKRCCEWTEALLTGKGQCTTKRGAHVHNEHVQGRI